MDAGRPGAARIALRPAILNSPEFLSVWVDYNRGIGQMREWFIKGLALSGVKPEDGPVELSI